MSVWWHKNRKEAFFFVSQRGTEFCRARAIIGTLATVDVFLSKTRSSARNAVLIIAE